jgi:O-acetyl-ADP-ribose deacetylase
MRAQVNAIVIELTQTEPFEAVADALVLPAESSLLLAPPLLTKVGQNVQTELARYGGCDVGGAVLTSGGKTSFKRLIHAVTPRWGEGSERGKLSSVTWESLALCESARLASVALPALSVGAYGYPLENCATTMISQIINYTFEPLKALRHIYLCLETAFVYEAFAKELTEQLRDLGEEGQGAVQV